MIVEDEGATAMVIQRSLEEMGYTITSVETTAEGAVNKVSIDKPDLVLMDISLAGEMDGIEAAEQIHSGSNIPIVYITAHSDEKIVQRIMKTEPFGYIIKPFDERDLRIAVEIALYKHGMESKLRDSEHRFHSLFNNATDSIFLFSPATDDLIIEDLNPAACAIHGYNREELIGKPISLLDDPETRKHIPERAKSLMSGNPLFFEAMHVRKDGSTFPVEISAQLINIDGKPYILATYRDITKRKRIEYSLKESEAKFRDLVESTSDWVWEINADGLYVYSSPKVKDILGYDVNEVLGKSPFYFMPEDEAEKSRTIFSQILTEQKPFYGLENINRHKDGHIVVLETSGVPVFNKSGNFMGFRGIDRDITQRKKVEERLKAISITDELTGLFNRRGFFTLAEKEFKVVNRHKRRMSLIYLDLDGLKAINDKLGHETGDQALVDAANILRKSFRESDIMGRMGGDEFAVLITDGSEADIEKIAVDHIQQNLKIHNEQAGRSYALLLSMGFAHYDPGSSCTISELIKQADSSMYEDKKRHNSKII
jgi:diguanylate cyclase (GGDEF)-like protein/PAS domain S-box-containing protein